MITWVDSSGMEGWQHLEHIKECWDNLDVVSVGWILEESDEAVLVVPHIASHGQNKGGQGRGDLTIPRCAIKELTILSEEPC